MNHLDKIKTKIFSDYSSFAEILNNWKEKEETIVFTNVCFDLVHHGHVEYLSKTANLGDKLIVGLNSDVSVKILKGESRPLINEESRAILLAAFEFIDAIILFSEDTPYDLISKILPDVLVKGDDYAMNEIAGFDIVLENGGKVETIELVPGISTSTIISKIKDLDDE